MIWTSIRIAIAIIAILAAYYLPEILRFARRKTITRLINAERRRLRDAERKETHFGA